jgi:hypothetical protein
MTVPVKLTFEDQFGNEISAEKELSVDRSTKPRPRLVRPTSIYDSDGVGATSEPGVSRVPDPSANSKQHGDVLAHPREQRVNLVVIVKPF